jgi:coiled-coil domain-containing protein 55
VFDYDGHVDAHLSDRRAKLAAADAERVDRKSRYVEALAAKQKERDREAAMVRERRLLREREREDHLYADKEKFVTAAYRAKLEADAKWIREDAARDAAEAADDVAKKSDLSGF